MIKDSEYYGSQGDIVDRPLQSIVQAQNPCMEFFGNGLQMRMGETYIVKAYTFKALEDCDFKKLANALSFAQADMITQGREADARFSGADFVNFLGKQIISRPASPPVCINENCGYIFRLNFLDEESYQYIYGMRLQITLEGLHLLRK